MLFDCDYRNDFPDIEVRRGLDDNEAEALGLRIETYLDRIYTYADKMGEAEYDDRLEEYGDAVRKYMAIYCR